LAWTPTAALVAYFETFADMLVKRLINSIPLPKLEAWQNGNGSITPLL
jgi:hypothetical protein